MHNIAFWNECDDLRVHDPEWDFRGPLVDPNHASVERAYFLQRHPQIRDECVHRKLKDALVEHMGIAKGNL
jgi:hypothetical protein